MILNDLFSPKIFMDGPAAATLLTAYDEQAGCAREDSLVYSADRLEPARA